TGISPTRTRRSRALTPPPATRRKRSSMRPVPASSRRRSPNRKTASTWKNAWQLSRDSLPGRGPRLGAMTLSTTQLLSIGRFAHTTGLTIRMLRRYDAIGLLVPAQVDHDTGYRWYTLEQARDGEAIRRLRELDVPLEEVRALVHAPPEELREGLAAHRARLEGRAVELRRTLDELSRLIDGKEQLVPEKDMVKFEIGIQDVAETKALVIEEHVQQDSLPEVIPADIAEVHDYVQELGFGFQGPPFCVCPYPNEDGSQDA